MTSQYETKRLITFDRIKIKSNYKYLLNTVFITIEQPKLIRNIRV